MRAPRLPCSRSFRAAAAALLAGAVTWIGGSAAAAPSPQVTSEIHCTKDADCPAHDFPCSVVPWAPGCGCDEGAGRCDPNPKACRTRQDCFGQETCDRGGHCSESAGFPAGALCNVDDDCFPWLACLNGSCGAVDCAVDGDCRHGQTCVRTRCAAPTGCHTDLDCGERQVCRDGACRGVQCKDNGDCGSCQICDSTNRCAGLCPSGQRCASFVAIPATAGGFATLVQRCVSSGTLACTSTPGCPLGEQCLGRRCLSLPKILDELNAAGRKKP